MRQTKTVGSMRRYKLLKFVGTNRIWMLATVLCGFLVFTAASGRGYVSVGDSVDDGVVDGCSIGTQHDELFRRRHPRQMWII